MSPIIKLEGTHGTTKDNYLKIQIDGFKVGQGRIGKAVYLWSDKLKFGYDLAVAWVVKTRDLGRHNQKNGLVLSCCAEIKKDLILDIELEEIKSLIAEIAANSGKNVDNENDICAIHDLFFREYEENAGFNVVAIVGRVAPPPIGSFKGSKKYPIKLLGAPIVYAIRDPGIIRILKTTEFDL